MAGGTPALPRTRCSLWWSFLLTVGSCFAYKVGFLERMDAHLPALQGVEFSDNGGVRAMRRRWMDGGGIFRVNGGRFRLGRITTGVSVLPDGARVVAASTSVVAAGARVVAVGVRVVAAGARFVAAGVRVVAAGVRFVAAGARVVAAGARVVAAGARFHRSLRSVLFSSASFPQFTTNQPQPH